MNSQQYNYQIINYDTDTGGKFVGEDSHVTLRCKFEPSGAGCWADTATFELYDSDNALITDLYLLRNVQQYDPEETGDYITTFLTNGLTAGNYTAKWLFTYNGSDFYVEGTFELYETEKTQYLIDQLRTLLGYHFKAEIPSRYLVFDPTREWTDGELYNALVLALSDINYCPPILSTNFVLDNIPCVSILLKGAMIYALMSMTTFEISQYFRVSEPIGVDLYKGDKFQSLLRDLHNALFLEWLKKWKLNYAQLAVEPVYIRRMRIPYRVLRPLSMNLNFTSLFPY